MITSMFTEIKARKAKFGFNGPSLSLKTVVEMGIFVKEVQREFSPGDYILEESGYHPTFVKFYTDDEAIAQWFRYYWDLEPLA